MATVRKQLPIILLFVSKLILIGNTQLSTEINPDSITPDDEVVTSFTNHNDSDGVAAEVRSSQKPDHRDESVAANPTDGYSNITSSFQCETPEFTTSHYDVTTGRTSKYTSQEPEKPDTTDAFRGLGQVNVTTADIKACLEKSGSSWEVVEAAGGFIIYDYEGCDDCRKGNAYCYLKISVPEGMVVEFELLQFRTDESVCSFTYLSVRDDLTNKYDMLMDARPAPCMDIATQTLTYTHVARVELVTPLAAKVSLMMKFTAVPESTRPHLQLVYSSPTSGYIQTPGWEKQTPYPKFMDSTVRVDVPENHSVLISFEGLDMKESNTVECYDDKIQLYLGRVSSLSRRWMICDTTNAIPPTLYKTDIFFLRFYSNGYDYESYGAKGFRLLLFSFHPPHELPERLASGHWNCSVPYFHRFQQHLPCNLLPECHNHADERDCPYTDVQLCGEGRLSLGGRCYLYVKPAQERIRWIDASVGCLQRGARLASLRTPAEMQQLARLLERLDFQRVFLGIRTSPSSLPVMYQDVFMWADGTMAFYANITGPLEMRPVCGYFQKEFFVLARGAYQLDVDGCYVPFKADFLCEFDPMNSTEKEQNLNLSSSFLTLPAAGTWSSVIKHVQCPSGHMTHDFLACDVKTDCWAKDYSGACAASLTPLPPSFACTNGIERVPYTLVCDFRSDCSDGSDEDFCVFPPCDVNKPVKCGNQQCVSYTDVCGGKEDCADGSDEDQCPQGAIRRTASNREPPAVVDLFRFDHIYINSMERFTKTRPFTETELQFMANTSSRCPEAHFECPGVDYYCLSLLMRCNGQFDCPGHEDEAGCAQYTCPGYYRCRASAQCVHHSQLCDGKVHCPQHDDELQCEPHCPHNCTCYNLSFFCNASFSVDSYPDLRYVDGRGTGMAPEDFENSTWLVYLSLANCAIKDFCTVHLPNLRTLDISDNRLTAVHGEQFTGMPNIRTLILSGNPVISLFERFGTPGVVVSSLEILDVSRVPITELDAQNFSIFPSLQVLNLSETGVEVVLGQGFKRLHNLRELDLTGCPVTLFPRDVFSGLDGLQAVSADNYRLCCQASLPTGFNPANCRAPWDEISSCEALLRSTIYRVFLSVFAGLSLVGNGGSLLYRLCVNRTPSNLGFDVFVSHLCVADLLMGVYLAIVGIADRVYLGSYLWQDVLWRESAACTLAGFLALMSSEVSAAIICLITLDRFLVLRFPFRQQLHFRRKSAHVASAVAWVVGAVIAVIPLLPVTSHWRFYSQTGICLPLPLTQKEFPGQGYSFAIMIVLNFVLFLLIAAGQASIFWSIRSSSMAPGDSTSKSKDLAIAQRLISIALSDFLCWFPIGLLGLLAASGTPIPGEVNVAMAIFVLPFNSALNPFLYTLNTLLERRRRQQEQRLKQMLMSERTSKTASTALGKTEVSKKEARDTLQAWVNQGLIAKEKMIELCDK